MEEYNCLNCGEKIEFEEDSNYITTCGNCGWRNELNDTPTITPIVMKTKTFEDFTSQISYPLIEERDLEELPASLKEAVITFFKNPGEFSAKHYQNIYHNLYKKNASEFLKIAKKYQNKGKLAFFFQRTNFLK